MAYLNKKQYDYRREKAAERMQKNAEINTLTEEQHELIANLCTARHELHSNKPIIEDHQGLKNNLLKINDEIRKVGLEPMNFIGFYSDGDYIDIDEINELERDNEDNDKKQEWYDSNYERISSELEDLNTKIEKYLLEIDKKYGTNYCPTGLLRMEGNEINNIEKKNNIMKSINTSENQESIIRELEIKLENKLISQYPNIDKQVIYDYIDSIGYAYRWYDESKMTETEAFDRYLKELSDLKHIYKFGESQGIKNNTESNNKIKLLDISVGDVVNISDEYVHTNDPNVSDSITVTITKINNDMDIEGSVEGNPYINAFTLKNIFKIVSKKTKEKLTNENKINTESIKLRNLIRDYLFMLDCKEHINVCAMIEQDTELNRLIDIIESKMLADPDSEIEKIVNEIELSTYNF